MRSRERSFTPRTDSSWQEEAAQFLLRSGFRPSNTIGRVEHIANEAGGTRRTFGSVWHAMRSLVEQERSGSKARDLACNEPLQ